MRVLPLGISFSNFRPEPSARESFRKDLGISNDVLLLGNVARFSREKNIEGFIKMAAGIRSSLDQPCKVVLAGKGLDRKNFELMDMSEKLGLDDIMLLGEIDDMPGFYNALDVFISVSSNEAFSLALLEAIACEVPAFALASADPVGLLDNVKPEKFSALDIDTLQKLILQFLQLDSSRQKEMSALLRDTLKPACDESEYFESMHRLYLGLLN
jgi:glycosyltransferase involved in cell wall biosynthesis